MNKSEMFKTAHEDARNEIESMGGDYRIQFSLQLKVQWSMVSKEEVKSDFSEWSLSEIYNAILLESARIETGSFTQTTIIEDVAEKSNGFQSDIAKKVLENGKISIKQAWCVAYEFKKVA